MFGWIFESLLRVSVRTEPRSGLQGVLLKPSHMFRACCHSAAKRQPSLRFNVVRKWNSPDRETNNWISWIRMSEHIQSNRTSCEQDNEQGPQNILHTVAARIQRVRLLCFVYGLHLQPIAFLHVLYFLLCSCFLLFLWIRQLIMALHWSGRSETRSAPFRARVVNVLPAMVQNET